MSIFKLPNSLLGEIEQMITPFGADMAEQTIEEYTGCHGQVIDPQKVWWYGF